MNVWPGSAITWEDAGNSGGVTWTQIGNNLRFYFSGPDQYAYFRAYVTNACGTSNALYRFRSVEGDCGGPPLRVYISPNPSKDKVLITLGDKFNKNRTTNIYQIKVLDKLGNVRKRFIFGKGLKNPTININTLNIDVYAVMVFDGKRWFTAKLVKN